MPATPEPFGTPEKLYPPQEGAKLFGVGLGGFYELLSAGTIPPADLYLSPKRPRWYASTLRAAQEKLAALRQAVSR